MEQDALMFLPNALIIREHNHNVMLSKDLMELNHVGMPLQQHQQQIV